MHLHNMETGKVLEKVEEGANKVGSEVFEVHTEAVRDQIEKQLNTTVRDKPNLPIFEILKGLSFHLILFL